MFLQYEVLFKILIDSGETRPSLSGLSDEATRCGGSSDDTVLSGTVIAMSLYEGNILERDENNL